MILFVHLSFAMPGCRKNCFHFFTSCKLKTDSFRDNILPYDPTKLEPVKINLMKRLRSVSLIKKCKSWKMQGIRAY